MSIEGMKQALEALDSDNPDIQLRAATALRAAIEQADARLISAAPDLYEALQEIVDAADGTGWDQLDATFTRARAALKQARGER